MARAAVVNAFQTRLKANWTATPIYLPNTDVETPIDGSSFISLQFPVTNEEQITVGAPGNNVWRQEGVARIVISVPTGRGIDQMITYADTLAAVFRGKYFDGVETFEVNGPVYDDDNENGNYFVASLAIVYQHDLFG